MAEPEIDVREMGEQEQERQKERIAGRSVDVDEDGDGTPFTGGGES